VENDRCSAGASAVRSNFLRGSGPAQWRRVSVKLKAGVNILSWQVYSLVSGRDASAAATTASAAIKIRLIEIRGQCCLCGLRGRRRFRIDS